MPKRLLVFLPALLLLAACGATGASTAVAHHARPVLPAARGVRICNDLVSWFKQAMNEYQPRFTPTMEADEHLAQRDTGDGTLGTDLWSLDNDLYTMNGAALFPGPPGQPSDADNLKADCALYGVMLHE
jgi:hypothetical protein